MTRTRQAIIAFWVIIIAMLIWQFYDYNQSMTEKAQKNVQPDHFFFMHTNSMVAPAAPVSQDALLRQTAFSVLQDTPSLGNFTCQVTVKNIGLSKAINVQIHVRPFKGSLNGDEDNDAAAKPLPDTDPTSQMGQWVSLADIPPGQTATGTAIFLVRPGINPGHNPNPEIEFQSEKADKPAPKRTAPPSE